MGVFGHVIRELSRPLWAALSRTARSTHRIVKIIEPWGIGLAVLGFGLSAIVVVIDLDDRQAERTFRAWEVVLSSQGNPNGGNSMKLALEYLNREYTPPTWICGEWIRLISKGLTGNTSRNCFIPKKDRASFEGAKFNKSDLRGANLGEANLTGATLSGANLSWAGLARVDLTGAKLQRTRLAWADLVEANLAGADLRGADVEEADLMRAKLTGVDLTGAILAEANLAGVDLLGADLTGASLSWANLAEANITQVQLNKACSKIQYPPLNLPKELEWRSGPCPEK